MDIYTLIAPTARTCPRSVPSLRGTHGPDYLARPALARPTGDRGMCECTVPVSDTLEGHVVNSTAGADIGGYSQIG